jgi:tRNA-dihydrouridine synthase A
MMQRTHRHQRYFVRLISKHAMLYTEMIPASALVRGNPSHLLEHHPSEHPLALQIGGSDPREMGICAVLARDYGFVEVNINVGCPSTRVQAGRFGVCLMAAPETVAACVARMRAAADIPISVKTRIGLDHQDSYDFLAHFIDTVARSGCGTFIVHARKAWLRGLSPKENRHRPPLRYDVVRQLKGDFPELEIIVNGGIQTLDEAQCHLSAVDGVMIGREVYRNPYFLATIDRRFYADHHPIPTRYQVLETYLPYAAEQISRGISPSLLTRHLFGLFHGQPGARPWRRDLSQIGGAKGKGIETFIDDSLRALQTAKTTLAGAKGLS